ncbi:MAG: Fic family protein [Alphaproteobacteria bacterium]
MNTAQQYLHELKDLHGEIAGNPDEDFRGQPVICVDRHDREIHFTPHAQIGEKMTALLSAFAEEFKDAADVRAVSAALAKFYYGIIAIHPFTDANRRTAFAFIERRAREKSYAVSGIALLRNCLFEGKVAREMEKLTALFTHILKPA